MAGDIARKLHWPAARVELAYLDKERGVISLDVREHQDLVHGNEVLAGRDPSYAAHRRHQVPGYRVDVILQAFRELGVQPPRGAHLISTLQPSSRAI